MPGAEGNSQQEAGLGVLGYPTDPAAGHCCGAQPSLASVLRDPKGETFSIRHPGEGGEGRVSDSWELLGEPLHWTVDRHPSFCISSSLGFTSQQLLKVLQWFNISTVIFSKSIGRPSKGKQEGESNLIFPPKEMPLFIPPHVSAGVLQPRSCTG